MQFDLVLKKAPVRTSWARAQMLEKLASLRKEWEATAGTDSLLDITTSTGLILLDIATHLELNAEERLIFLGQRLEREIATVIEA